VIVCDETFEKMEKDKEYFYNAVQNIFDDTYDSQYSKGMSESFYQHIVKKMNAA
jgi:hypothetical protein